MADALILAGGGNQRAWDAYVLRHDEGWTIELEIPFRTLNFDPDAPAWGINFQRTIRRRNEENYWEGHERNQQLQRMSDAGLLLGISDVTQGRGLDVPQAIDVGGKLTGQMGTQDIGLLHVRTGEQLNSEGKSLFGEDFTVFRMKRRLLTQSYVGSFFTRRDAGASDDLYTAGLDFRLATSGFRGSNNLSMSGCFLWNTGPEDLGEGLSRDASGNPSRRGVAGQESGQPGNPAWEAGFRSCRPPRAHPLEAA